MYLELLNSEVSVKQLKASKPLPKELPVKVLSAWKQTAEWKEDQSKLLDLTNNTQQVKVEDSWHAIQIHKPEAVINAINDMISKNQ